MLLFNRKSFITGLILIAALLGQMLNAMPAQAAQLEGPDIDKSGRLLHKSATNISSEESDHSGVSQIQATIPTVVTTSPQHGDVLLNNPSTISVQFSNDMLANRTAFAVNKPANYLLVEDGADENGDYSFSVPYNWIGTVIPTKADYRFMPGNIDYFGVQADR